MHGPGVVNPMVAAVVEALLAPSQREKAVYTRPAGGHYYSVRAQHPRNRGPSKRSAAKARMREQMLWTIKCEKAMEADWRSGLGPRPPWAHASARTLH